MRTLLLSVVCFCLLSLPVSAQTVKNPTLVQWDESSDHASLDTYVMDIVRVSDDVVIQTIDVGLGTVVSGVTRQASINVQPISFGDYYCVLRAVAGSLQSENSDPSNSWQRVPGRPSNAVVQ